MIWAILTVSIVFIILLLAEYLSRAKGIHSELTRKFVHMSVGTFVAFWPFFLSWRQIQLLSLAFFIVILVSVKLNVFRSIHAVQRNALGEILFAAIIGFLALISPNAWVFLVAMLHLSIADGVAAVVGILWGDNRQYKVFGRIKSVPGTVAFFASSLAISLVYIIFGPGEPGLTTLVLLPVLTTVTENMATHGTDNLFMPLVAAVVLLGT